MTEQRTTPDERTREAERAEARTSSSADRPPTTDEERRAEENEPVDESVAEAAREATERGAAQKGEGRLDVSSDESSEED